VGLQLGAFAVVLETKASGISELPFGTFLLLMQPIHLAIGVVEGIVTAAVVLFVWKARPEVLAQASGGSVPMKKVLAGLALAAVLTGGILSWFASSYPDGLEWSMAKTSGSDELESPEGGLHGALSALQEKLAFLPDYGFRKTGGEEAAPEQPGESAAWPAVDPGTTVSGLVGGGLTLALAGLAGLVIKRMSSKRA